MIRKVLNLQRFGSVASRYYGPSAEIRPQPKIMSPWEQYTYHFRKHGHHFAQVDPIKLFNPAPLDSAVLDFNLRYDQKVQQVHGYISEQVTDPDQYEKLLKKAYCGSVGVEFEHVVDEVQKKWLYYEYEKAALGELSNSQKKNIHELMVKSEAFDHFLAKKFITFKRYSGQGAQTAQVALRSLFGNLANSGTQEVIVGIPHRGRFNFLTGLLNYPPRLLFRKINGGKDVPNELYGYIDDVTSHLACSCRRVFEGVSTSPITVSTVHNPSHLQAQNPVSLGKSRAKQDQGDVQKIANVQIHGDAAFPGQGIVAESLLLGKLPGYNVNGTIHLVVNNQLGYTTYPVDSRSSKYCTDICKSFGIPIIHVNAADPEIVHRLMKVMADYRSTFKKDILMDLVCFRKYGHNEVDEPSFTQPVMYKTIRQSPSLPQQYHLQLKQQSIVNDTDYKQIKDQLFEQLQMQFNKKDEKTSLQDLQKPDFNGNRFLTGKWQSMKPSIFAEEVGGTGIEIEQAKNYALASVTMPPGFTVHPRLSKFFIEERKKEIEKDKLGWATCEAIAFYSLVQEGYGIRMTGQDVERGTFSQRHIKLIDNKNQQVYSPLAEFAHQCNSKVEIFNSPLSENAVLGYEYGYAIQSPRNLVIWQAQFGDFYNTAQPVVDTFISNSEAKWLRQNGLVMILPHGYDGAGPEHTSCRIQRFLMLANSNGSDPSKIYAINTGKYPPDQGYFYEDLRTANFSFCFPTSPSNYFHLLRRQMKNQFRKPLILAGPKTLLRLSECVSSIHSLSPSKSFQPVLEYHKSKTQKKVLLTSGKFVFDVLKIVQDSDCRLLTVEELFPFPYLRLEEELAGISAQTEIVWVQEEALNSGAFSFVKPRIEKVLNKLKHERGIGYMGRPACSATAVGSVQQHKIQLQSLLQKLKHFCLQN